MAECERAWQIFLESRQAVVRALEQGKPTGYWLRREASRLGLPRFCWKLACGRFRNCGKRIERRTVTRS